jgi:predicted DCC family thiol-disulfide oxidoreductase YuxK
MTDAAVFLYDGDCAFCTRCVSLLQRHLRTPARIVAWQAIDLTSLAVTQADCAAAVQWVAAGQVNAGPAAFASLLRSATRTRDLGWRLAGRFLASRPVLAAAWPAYRFMARHRHQMPGGTARCMLPHSSGG